MVRKTSVLLGAVALFVSSFVFGEEAQMRFVREAVGQESHPPAPRIAAQVDLIPAVTLAAAEVTAPEQLDAIREWNASGRLPVKAGFVRRLVDPVAVRISGVVAKGGPHGRGIVAATSSGTAYATSLRVENAKRLRLHLEDLRLPESAHMWVYGTDGRVRAVDTAVIDEKGSVWTPSVDGDTIYLEVEVPAGSDVSFAVRELVEILYRRGLRPDPDDDPVCLQGTNVACKTAATFSSITAASAAVGQMEFIDGAFAGVCSGTLVGDQAGTSTPYFLTANHCIDTQSVAGSLETYFDFKFTACSDTASVDYQDPVRGATLLVTSPTTDVTLLRLPSVPAGRWYLGWTTGTIANGTPLHRISHPVPDGFDFAFPQLYSRTMYKSTGGECPGRNRPNYHYSNESNGGEGGVYGGSSGSSAILANGQVVGQLLGSCGPDPAAGCDRRNDTVDGSFARSFDLLRPYLSSTGTQPQPCTPNSSTICIVDNRFSVRLQVDRGSGFEPVTAIKYTANSGLFWFQDSSNIEVIVKMLNACVAPFNRFWVYAGGTTDQGISITVTDTKNGTTWTRTHQRGTPFQTITDSNAFATCP